MKGIRLKQTTDGRIDIDLTAGSITVGDTSIQEEALVLLTQRGEWKEYPLIGVGLADMVGDEDVRYWKREITENLARVGIKIKGVIIKNEQVEIKH